MYEPTGTFTIENEPSSEEAAPMAVPSMDTFAPTRGVPSFDYRDPLIFPAVCDQAKDKNSEKESIVRIFLILFSPQ